MNFPVELDTPDKIRTVLARGAVKLPEPIIRRLAGKPVEQDGYRLDPWVQMILRLQRLAGARTVARDSVPAARRDLDITGNQLSLGDSLGVEARATELGGRPARIYRPRRSRGDGRSVLWMHGGGFAIGSLDSHDGPCRMMADRLGATVLALDYRLAPEHPFPAAVEDTQAALRSLHAQAPELALDRSRIVVAGDSAGANLALVASLEARGTPHAPVAVLAVYPVTDFTMSAESHRTLGKGYFLEADDIRFYREAYLAGAEQKHPLASVFWREDLEGLPPTVLVTAGFDPLRDEGMAYAEKLRDAGSPIHHRCFEDLFHGFWNAPLIPAAGRAIEATLDLLDQQLPG